VSAEQTAEGENEVDGSVLAAVIAAAASMDEARRLAWTAENEGGTKRTACTPVIRHAGLECAGETDLVEQLVLVVGSRGQRAVAGSQLVGRGREQFEEIGGAEVMRIGSDRLNRQRDEETAEVNRTRSPSLAHGLSPLSVHTT
jgi:hypothetical protein